MHKIIQKMIIKLVLKIPKRKISYFSKLKISLAENKNKILDRKKLILIQNLENHEF